MVRKIIISAMLLALMLSFSACGKNSAEEITTAQPLETTAAVPGNENTTAYQESTSALQQATTAEITTQAATQAIVTTAATTVPTTQSVSSWDAQRVVSFYKEAAAATGNTVKSEQVIALEDISVNNGQLGGVFSFVTPILSSFLSSSSTVTDGITGDFSLLSVQDVSSARAYETAKGTAVEITLREQSVNAAEKDSDVGISHGISVVADLPSIMSQLRDKGLPIEISLEKTVMTYKNPVIKAVVDENGKIVNGTWSCTVEISLSDYKFAGSAVESTRVVLDNKITVASGFNP